MKERQPKIMEAIVKVFISLALRSAFGVFFRPYNALVMMPEKLRYILRKQGISGPPPYFLLGNIMEIRNSQSIVVTDSSMNIDTHIWATSLFPFFELWKNKYGRTKFSSFFPQQSSFISIVVHSLIIIVDLILLSFILIKYHKDIV